MEREQTAYRSLLPLTAAVLADPEPMPSVLVWYAGASPWPSLLAVIAVGVACSHGLADAVKGGQLKYMTLALQREPTAYRPLLTRARAAVAGPERMLSRLVRGCIALAFTASVRAVAPPC